MSLLSDLNRIVSDRRLANDLEGNEPSVPPAPVGVPIQGPQRTKGQGCGFAAIALSPPSLTTLNQGYGGNPSYTQLSATTAGFATPSNQPGFQTRIGGPEAGSSSPQTTLSSNYINIYGPS